MISQISLGVEICDVKPVTVGTFSFSCECHSAGDPSLVKTEKRRVRRAFVLGVRVFEVFSTIVLAVLREL
jgi:hypothetical protein